MALRSETTRPVTSPAVIAARWQQRRAEIESTPVPQHVAELLETSARRFGDSVAWSFFESDENWTFSEARDYAHRVANALASLGIGPGDRVAVMLPNRGLYLALWFGLAVMGAAIVPVNIRYTSREIDHVLGVSGARLLVVDASLAGVLDDIDERFRDRVAVVLADGEDSLSELVLRQSPQHTPERAVASDDLLNVQFTSGTTGFPKGCMLTHRYWTNVAVTWDGYLDVAVENILVNQRLFYVDGQFNALFALARGATLHCCTNPSASKFLDWVRRFRINSAFYFDPMFKVDRTDDDTDNQLNVLHTFGFRTSLQADLEARYAVPARESFGMTEMAPILMMPLDAEIMVGSGSCGLAAPFVETKLVDDDDNEVELGRVGELAVRSPAMMTGYVGDPEATAQTIRDGWLHTGDLFRQDGDGFYYLEGRTKDMVRRNAENVSCREVEEIIRHHPAVHEVAVIGVPDEWVGEEIHAFLQLSPGLSRADLDMDELIAWCARDLAAFKLPRYISVVADFSMTESSRVEKKKLNALIGNAQTDTFDRQVGGWNR